jgi:hypothetical protein
MQGEAIWEKVSCILGGGKEMRGEGVLRGEDIECGNFALKDKLEGL